MRILYFFILCNVLPFFTEAQNLHLAVNPFIGTGGHGHTYPGATRPFAMVQLSPDTRIDGSWDGCSGYHYNDSVIYGFSHTHLNGTGCSDYGDIAFMPVWSARDDLKFAAIKFQQSFKHSRERASAGYYQVTLKDGIKVELTSTERVGIQRYTSPKNGFIYVVLNHLHRDELLQGKITQVNNKTYEGLRRSKAWATDQWVYFHTQFSNEPIKTFIQKGKNGDEKLFAVFKVQAKKPLLIKTALSSVQEQGAARNMKAEMNHFNFDQVKKTSEQIWNKQLSKIKVEADGEKRNVFYTALYHTMIQPNIMNDVDGQYRGRDNRIHKAEGFNYYTVFSLWDTYRAAHPLYTIIEPERTVDFIKTFLTQFQQSGRLPMWELWGNETDCMIGYHAVSVITDAMVKGYKNFDTNLAWKACLAATEQKIYGTPIFNRKGYLELEDEHESVSKSLEYAYDNWCAAQLALRRKDTKTYQTLIERSRAGYHLMDNNTGLMRPRSNGGWQSPFDPFQVNNNYTEANSWQYSFSSAFNNYYEPDLLYKIFETSSKTTGREQADITGLIGQYAHGNEPSHHIAWLFTQRGDVQSTYKYVYKILTEFYKNTPDGLIGNEDCGQMSAWYVLSSLGFYPVNPGDGKYTLGYPLFRKAMIETHLGPLVIEKSQAQLKPDQSYQWATTGLAELPFIVPHTQLLKAGKIKVNAIPKGAQQKLAPIPRRENLYGAPLLQSKDGLVFEKETSVSVDANRTQHASVKLMMQNIWKPYLHPVQIKDQTTLTAALMNTAGKEVTTTATYYKRPNNYTLRYTYEPNPQYTAGGSKALLDGLKGDEEWRKGNWVGVQEKPFEAIIDMKSSKNIREVEMNFLRDQRAWIFYPKAVQIFSSANGLNWKEVGSKNIAFERSEDKDIEKVFIRANATGRYIKVVAQQYGMLPSWHQGAGGESYIFIDEITLR